MATLPPARAKKLRRYSRKPGKCGYTVQRAGVLTPAQIHRCYVLFCETMTWNGDDNYYPARSFVAYLQQVPVLLATRIDSGEVLGSPGELAKRRDFPDAV